MASLWKHPQSKFWVACFTDVEGRQRKQSTKVEALEKNRKKAMRIADDLEAAHRRRYTTTQILRMCTALVKDITGQDLPAATIRGFLDGYLERRKDEVKPATLLAYKGTVKSFLEWLDESADMELIRLERRHLIDYRDHISSRVSKASANKYVKYLRVFFRDAKREGLLLDNPCEEVATLKREKTGPVRRGFTLDELRIVLREVEGTEWVSLIRFGLYTGQRLSDLVHLRWNQIDMQNDEIRITTAKTGRVVIVPICEPLKEHLLSLPAGDKPGAFVHPKAAEMGTSHLSREFGEVLGRCGFRREMVHRKLEGRTGEARTVFELSFHSLRHTAVSMMKNAGISPAIVQDLIGHESVEMSAHYTHIESDAKRKALETLPKL